MAGQMPQGRVSSAQFNPSRIISTTHVNSTHVDSFQFRLFIGHGMHDAVIP